MKKFILVSQKKKLDKRTLIFLTFKTLELSKKVSVIIIKKF